MNKQLDIVAVGHALVDIRIIVDKLPGPDEEADIREESRGAGGSAVNVAIDAARLGGRSGIVAKIGFDQFGRIVYEELWRNKVDLRGLRISPQGETGFSIVVITRSGDIAIYGHKGVADDLEPGEVDADLISDAKTVHIASLRLDTSIRAAQLARQVNAIVSWDPGRRLAQLGLERLSPLLRYVDVVFLNQIEAKAMTGREPLEAAKAIARHGPRHVVVKMGEKGALYYGVEGQKHIEPYPAPRVVDTTGAGDAFAAATLLRIAQGADILKALQYASLVAALKVSRLGSHNVPSEKEVKNMLENSGQSLTTSRYTR